jgi:hypothetical protein
MSTLNVSNITDGTTTVGTSYVVNGSAKAWVNMNGTGTIAIRDSLNVASLTDAGTGQYRMNFTNSFAAVDYAFSGTAGDDRSGNSALRVCNGGLWDSTVSNCLIQVSAIASGINRIDADDPQTTGIVLGDLA